MLRITGYHPLIRSACKKIVAIAPALLLVAITGCSSTPRFIAYDSSPVDIGTGSRAVSARILSADVERNGVVSLDVEVVSDDQTYSSLIGEMMIDDSRWRPEKLLQVDGGMGVEIRSAVDSRRHRNNKNVRVQWVYDIDHATDERGRAAARFLLRFRADSDDQWRTLPVSLSAERIRSYFEPWEHGEEGSS